MPPENVAHTNAEHDDADDAGPTADPQDFVPPVEAHSVARGARRLLDTDEERHDKAHAKTDQRRQHDQERDTRCSSRPPAGISP